MVEGTLSSYGGGTQEAEDSRRTQEFLNRRGKLNIKYARGKVILSIEEEMPTIPQAEYERGK